MLRVVGIMAEFARPTVPPSALRVRTAGQSVLQFLSGPINFLPIVQSPGNSLMRRIQALLATLAFAAAPVLAQNKGELQPLPAVPPPPPEMAPFDAALEPEVTIIKREGNTVEEHRINGRLFMIKVTPEHGVPYYLVDRKGDGNFSRETMGNADVSVPMWVIGTF